MSAALLGVAREFLAWTGPNYLGEVKNHRYFYGSRRGTRAVRGFKLRFTGLRKTRVNFQTPP